MLGSGRVSSDLFAKALSIPSSCGLTEPERARVVKALESARIPAGGRVSAGAAR